MNTSMNIHNASAQHQSYRSFEQSSYAFRSSRSYQRVFMGLFRRESSSWVSVSSYA